MRRKVSALKVCALLCVNHVTLLIPNTEDEYLLQTDGLYDEVYAGMVWCGNWGGDTVDCHQSCTGPSL